jgi:phytoene desaturase
MAESTVVLGAGISGLATAALLAKNGRKVTVLEKNEMIGGRARVLKKDGFTFDMGPSWYMMPDEFERYFGLFGARPSDFYDLIKLKTHYKLFFPEGRGYTITDDLKANEEVFERTEPGAGMKLRKFVEKSKWIYERSMKELVRLDYESLLPLLKPSLLKDLFSFRLTESYHHYVASYFRNPDLQKIMEFMTVFLGGSPYNTPAFYNLIAHVDFNLGSWYPKGGIHQVPKALEALCQKYGVEILKSQNAVRCEVKDGQAVSLETDRKSFQADSFVMSADYRFCETALLERPWQTYPQSYWDRKTLAPSCFLMYIGLNGKVKNLEHHNLYFDDSWDRHFSEVYDESVWPETPSYYIHVPSKTDPSMAPAGCDTVFVLVPIAAGLKSDEAFRQKFGDRILDHIEKVTGERMKDRIVTRTNFTVEDFESSYNAFKGAAFGLAHTLPQTAVFRCRNRSHKVNNLFYTGQYTNPGVGMPPCLISAQITSRLVEADDR